MKFSNIILLFGILFLLNSTAEAQWGNNDRSGWMKRYDSNGDGILHPDELKNRRGRHFVEQAARRAGLDPSKPISITKLSESMNNNNGNQGGRNRGGRNRGNRNRDDRNRDNNRDRNNNSTTNTKKDESSKLPGFASETNSDARVPGFDGEVVPNGKYSKYLTKIPLEDQYEGYILQYVDRNILRPFDHNKNKILEPDEIKKGRWADPPGQDDANKDGRLTRGELASRMARRWGKGRKKIRTVSSTVSSKDLSKYRDYARSMIRQYDKNGNGFLEKEEWSRMSSFNRGSDNNGDGIITLDELASRLGSYGSNSSGNKSRSYSKSRNRSSKRSSWRLKSNDDKWYGKKSYRAGTATELLPDGLPKWFAQKDVNADGQVAMSEYSVTWKQIDLEEYNKYDLNQDGFITPKEVLEAKK